MRPAQPSTPLPQGLGIPVSDWQQTPTSVRDEFLALLQRVEWIGNSKRLFRSLLLAARLRQRPSLARGDGSGSRGKQQPAAAARRTAQRGTARPGQAVESG